MIALLACLIQSPAPAAPIVYEEQEIFSSTRRTKLVYRVPPHRADPIELEVFRGQDSLWIAQQSFEFDVASVDDRGWAAGLRWTKPPVDLRNRIDFVPGRGHGELIAFNASGAIAARRFVVEDPGWSCLTDGLSALDLLCLDDGTLLLRTSQGFGPPAGRGEGWQAFRSSDLERVSAASPGAPSGRPKTPVYLPLEWGEQGAPALEVKVVPGTGLLAVRWPFPEWRAVEVDDNENTGGGVQLLEIFSLHLSNAVPVAEFALPALPPSKEIDPEFNLAIPRHRAWRAPVWFRGDAPQRFSLRRGLDGAWIEVSVTSADGVWSAKLDPR